MERGCIGPLLPGGCICTCYVVGRFSGRRKYKVPFTARLGQLGFTLVVPTVMSISHRVLVRSTQYLGRYVGSRYVGT